MFHLPALREILRYVPQFRDKVFVIALDGAVVDDENFGNLLLDIALLRSLRIGVVLVHGAGFQIRKLAEQIGQNPSNVDGTGVTDPATMQLALTASYRVTHKIMEGLAATDLRGVQGNCLVAHPAGILRGIDYQLTGRVERVDIRMLQDLMAHDLIPVIPPLGCDGEGNTFRLNSDAVAVEVARALQAVKLILLTTDQGIRRGDVLLRHLSVEEAETILKKFPQEVPPLSVSKLEHAIRAARQGVPRIHIIDGRLEEGLLAEVFSNEGIGTLVHGNEYQAIRQAQKKDVRAIWNLVRRGMETDELMHRTRQEIERQVGDFFIFEVDRSPVACAAIHLYPEQGKAELACVCVDPKYENQGIGVKMMEFAETQGRAAHASHLFCLSTQAFNYFMQKGGYASGTPEDLPPTRRERYERSGRNSQILTKKL